MKCERAKNGVRNKKEQKPLTHTLAVKGFVGLCRGVLPSELWLGIGWTSCGTDHQMGEKGGDLFPQLN